MQKKIFTRMSLNNWGGISHRILEFHEYVNLFSGKSGSGKSTVMDAIQVILYGSFSSNFLNKAADDAKNKRSVLGYLRGEQKDGTANREGQDFCSTIVLEIEDTGTHIVNCVGIGFEVCKKDTELKKYVYFSHSGRMPERGYLNRQGYPYTNHDIRQLVQERSASPDNRGKPDVNRIYPSKEAYLNTLYEGILGYIDGTRFGIMERNAIALRMTNGTGQFIRDYMFPKSVTDTISDISDQLGAYREIREKIEDLEERIGMLLQVKQAGDELQETEYGLVRNVAFLRCMDIQDIQNKIAAYEEDRKAAQEQEQKIGDKLKQLDQEYAGAEEELIQASADLKASDLGSRREMLEQVLKREQDLAAGSREWRAITHGLRRWEEDEIVTDYVSNSMLQEIASFGKGNVSEEQCDRLKTQIADAREIVNEELEDRKEKRREIGGRLKELRQLIDDMQNNRKSYDGNLRQARAALERKLGDRYGKPVHVYILADLFDVREEEWKNAIEGRMAGLKLSLITEPRYSHDAAMLFRAMKEFEEVDLINSDAVVKSRPEALPGSLYDAVETGESYVDACLKRYLGHIIKCRSVEELEEAGNGVTPDCYSYSNFRFRHLRRKDYTVRAFIGRTVSKAKLSEYMEQEERLQREYDSLIREIEALSAAGDFESLKHDADILMQWSRADRELEEERKKQAKLEKEIEQLEKGKYGELKRREEQCRKERDGLKEKLNACRESQRDAEILRVECEQKIAAQRQNLEEKSEGYVANAEIEQEVKEQLKHFSGLTLRNRKAREISELKEREDRQKEKLQKSRIDFNVKYPSCGLDESSSNQTYLDLLDRYRQDFEPKYKAEFEKQCDFVYKSLRGNVIATIHGDIKAAKRHTYEINRLLRRTNFSDSTYQIRIDRAQNENGQFYDMLMAEELDSKNLDNGGYEGQLSLEEDTFFQKYGQKIQLLIEKFMPARDESEQMAQQRRAEMEKYADYRNYLSFSMFEQVTDEDGHVIRENPVDEMAGKDSGGEGQNPKYVALLAGFAMLYLQQSNRDSKIRLVLLDEAFSKMDQERSEVCLKYARELDLQMIVCVPDERLQSLIRNVDCVYGFRRYQNQISMMHIDKGDYLKLMEGDTVDELEESVFDGRKQ